MLRTSKYKCSSRQKNKERKKTVKTVQVEFYPILVLAYEMEITMPILDCTPIKRL